MFRFVTAASTNPADSILLTEIGGALLVLGVELQVLTLAYVIITAFAASVVLRFTRSSLEKR